MSDHSTTPYSEAQDALAAWHATHPDATFVEIEQAVEEQITSLRAHLTQEQAGAGFQEERPLCRRCGSTMVAKTRSTRRLVLRGEAPLDLERSYLVCPSCGDGLFPPG